MLFVTKTILLLPPRLRGESSKRLKVSLGSRVSYSYWGLNLRDINFWFWIRSRLEDKFFEKLTKENISCEINIWKALNKLWNNYSNKYPLRIQIGSARLNNFIQRRVWSWLRMNASGRLNTCKSRGSTIACNWWRPAHGCVTRMQLTLYRGIARGNPD